MWVPSTGKVREPSPDELVTFEKRTDGRDGDRNTNMEIAIKLKLYGKDHGDESHEVDLSRFHHGVPGSHLYARPLCLNLRVTPTTPTALT